MFQFEGLGIIFPVQDVTQDPASYKRIVALVLVSLGSSYVVFSLYCVSAWGQSLNTPLITDQFEPTVALQLVKVLLMVNVLASVPYNLFPVNQLIEANVFEGWPKSQKRKMLKNLSRMIVLGFIVIIAVLLKHRLDQFVAVAGALSCAPIAFILPSLFHLKACPGTTLSKWVDISIACLGLIIMVFCTGLGLINWNR